MKKSQQKRSVGSQGTGGVRAENPIVGAFAVQVKEWRQKKGITLKTMAAAMDVGLSIICEWEHGHRFPSVDNLWALSKYTGIPACELIRPVKGGAPKKSRAR